MMDFDSFEHDILELIEDVRTVAHIFGMMNSYPGAPEFGGRRGCFWEGCEATRDREARLVSDVRKVRQASPISGCEELLRKAYECSQALRKFGEMCDTFPSPANYQIQLLRTHLPNLESGVSNILEHQIRNELAAARLASPVDMVSGVQSSAVGATVEDSSVEAGEISDGPKPYEISPQDWTVWLQPKRAREIFPSIKERAESTKADAWTRLSKKLKASGCLFEREQGRDVTLHRNGITAFGGTVPDLLMRPSREEVSQ